MNVLQKERLEVMRNTSRIEKDITELKKAEKSIENDEEFIKLYKMTVQKYLDNGEDPKDITFSQIIELDFDYFARTYGVRCFVVREKGKNVRFIDF